MDAYTSTSGVAGTRMKPLVGRSRSNVTTRRTVTNSAATTVAARPRWIVDKCNASCRASAPSAKGGTDDLQDEHRGRHPVLQRVHTGGLRVEHLVQGLDVEARCTGGGLLV